MSDERMEHGEHRRKLDKAFVGGMAWTAGAKWLTQLISWPAILITARLLSPADFGLVDMAGYYILLTNVLAEFGIGTAVLQMQELDAAAVEQLNTVSLLFGLATFGISVAVAPLIAAFFHAPQLTILVVVTSVSFIMTALQAAPMGLLQRDMDYRRLSIAEATQAVVQAAATIGCALAGYAYWSLIVGSMSGRLVSLIMTRYWHPVRFGMPRWNHIKKPLRFGLQVALSRLAWSLNLQSDGIVVGRMLGQTPLGNYRLALNLSSVPSEKIGTLIMRVTGPLFAKVQNDIELTRRYFLVLSDVLALAVFPFVLGLAVTAPDAVRVVLGAKWDGAIAPLQWLAIFMTLRTLSSLAGQVLVSLRFTQFTMAMSIVNLVVMPVAFVIGSRWGVAAVAAAWLITAPLTVVPVFVKLLRAIQCGLGRYLGILTPAMAASAAMVGAVISLRMWLLPAGWSSWARLGCEVAAGGVVYLGIVWAVHRERVMQYVRFLLELRKTQAAAAAE